MISRVFYKKVEAALRSLQSSTDLKVSLCGETVAFDGLNSPYVSRQTPDGVESLRRLKEKCKRQPTYLISEKNANALIKRHGLSFAQGESELSGFIIFKSDVTF